MKFKLGDKVKWVVWKSATDESYRKHFQQTATIMKIYPNGSLPYELKFADGTELSFRENELELATNKTLEIKKKLMGK